MGGGSGRDEVRDELCETFGLVPADEGLAVLDHDQFRGWDFGAEALGECRFERFVVGSPCHEDGERRRTQRLCRLVGDVGAESFDHLASVAAYLFVGEYGLGPTTVLASVCGNDCWNGMYLLAGFTTFAFSLKL